MSFDWFRRKKETETTETPLYQRYVNLDGKDIQYNDMPHLCKKHLGKKEMEWHKQYNTMWGNWNGEYHEWYLSYHCEDKVDIFKLEKEISKILQNDINPVQLEDTKYYIVTFHFDLVNNFRYHSQIFLVCLHYEIIQKIFKLLDNHFYDIRITDDANHGRRYDLKRLIETSDKNIFKF